MRYNLPIGILMVSLFFTSCSSNEIVLTKNGTSNYEIVNLDSASKSEYKAAITLQEYIFKITGAKLPIVDESPQRGDTSKIYIGNSKENKLAPQEVHIKTERKSIF